MFKDQMMNDLETFFNTDEFSETAKINGKDIDIILDDDRLSRRVQKEYDGLYVGDILYFAKSSDFLKKPKVDDYQEFGGKRCRVFDVREDKGVLEIILKRNEG